jgi:hypothetical protein
MSRVTVGILVAVVLAASACGSGRHTSFSTFSDVCGLSVPTPSGFHRTFWNDAGRGGVTIEDGRIGPGTGNPVKWSDDPDRVALAVGGNSGRNPGGLAASPTRLQLPITLDELAQGSGGLPYWSGGGEVGGEQCGVAVWLGPKAPAVDRAAVLDALQATKESP